MAANRHTRKPLDRRKKTTPKSTKGSRKSVLGKMAPYELATVLQALLKRHPELKAEAEAAAIGMVSALSVEDIAAKVFDAVTSLGLESLHGRAGNQPWGYVEPADAAWELLEEPVEDIIADMKRYMDLGLKTAAETICCGIVAGLHKAESVGSNGLLGWAPDFAEEEACNAVFELIRACPGKDRRAVHDRLVEALDDLVLNWHNTLSQTAVRALHGSSVS
jgi:hypothetical protein